MQLAFCMCTPNIFSWSWGSNPSRVKPRTWKTVLAACPAPCSVLMDGCKEAVHERCCHWLATSAAFTAKPAAWPTAQVSGVWRPQAAGDILKWHYQSSTMKIPFTAAHSSMLSDDVLPTLFSGRTEKANHPHIFFLFHGCLLTTVRF